MRVLPGTERPSGEIASGLRDRTGHSTGQVAYGLPTPSTRGDRMVQVSLSRAGVGEDGDGLGKWRGEEVMGKVEG